MNTPLRSALSLPLPGYLADHQYAGRPVLPAVEALDAIVSVLARRYPAVDAGYSHTARFLRFLDVPVGRPSLEATLEFCSSGVDVQGGLLTAKRAGAAALTRQVEHVTVRCVSSPRPVPLLPLDTACATQGSGCTLAAKEVYEQLVPFGPAYHNARDPIVLARAGATARVVCPGLSKATSPLGSPFPLDAAFHVACAWGQRYTGAVTFPVGYTERFVVNPTSAGGEYICHVAPSCVSHDPPGSSRGGSASLCVDIRLLDQEGHLREVVLGLMMEDVSRGRLAAPAWLLAEDHDPLEALRQRCTGMEVIEMDSLAPFASRVFSPREKSRWQRLGNKRRREFTAVRIACKRLTRSLSPGAEAVDPIALETLHEDGVRPVCRPAGSGSWHCAAAHDSRFAVAVVGEGPMGVDVEPISGKARRGMHLFLSSQERRLIPDEEKEGCRVATRLWTVKEAAAKAMDVNLAEAWEEVAVIETSNEVSHAALGDKRLRAFHADVDGHLFTLLPLDS